MSVKTKQHLMNQQLKAVMGDEKNFIANLSNAAALLFESLDHINWAGFYLFEQESGELVLGPFQGKVACIRISNGKGVCGTAFKNEETIIVPDVHEFPGHIVCDAASRSEIVVPLELDRKYIGVLDIDSPITNRFSKQDQAVLEEFVSILMNQHAQEELDA